MASDTPTGTPLKSGSIQNSEQHLSAKLEEMTVKDQKARGLEVKQNEDTGVIQVESLCMNCHKDVSFLRYFFVWCLVKYHDN